MDRREVEQLLQAIGEARSCGERVATATIVRVRGSAYRREGTRMLVRQDGSYACALSGGCLEPAVAEAALRVIATGTPALVNYDLSDDSVWGLSLGCSGAIDILIERLEDDEVTSAWLALLERDEPGVLITALAGVSGRALVASSGETVGRLDDAGLHEMAVGRARARLAQASPLSGVEWSGAEAIGRSEVFFEVNPPTPALLLFGAGPDAAPLAAKAWTLGFSVTVVDPRAAYLTPERFPTATRVPAHAGASPVPVPPGGFVVVMNHHLERDEASLRLALDSDAAYIGVLGPRSRYRKLLDGLAARGYEAAPARLACVRSPIGLAIGAETPDEVAVSILAEILAMRRGFAGGFLDGSAASLHRAPGEQFVARR